MSVQLVVVAVRDVVIGDVLEAITTKEAESIKIEAEGVSVASEIATMLVHWAMEMDSVLEEVVLPVVLVVGVSEGVILLVMRMDL